LLLLGLFSSNHSIIAFIPHTAPADVIPSKNHDTVSLTPNKTCIGENITIPKKKPPHVEKQSGQLISPDKNLPKN
jgi:hypothetical protein